MQLPPMPPRVARLPRDRLGRPVPWFAAWLDGEPDFRVLKPGAFEAAIKGRLCWVCGQELGRYICSPIGPMCAVTRVTSEPGCHRDCAEFSLAACPFMINPRMRRNTKNLPAEAIEPPGIHNPRNPGAMVLWTCKEFELFKANGGALINLGEPTSVAFWAQGRTATRAEAEEALSSGVEVLTKMAEEEGAAALQHLAKLVEKAQSYLPQVV